MALSLYAPHVAKLLAYADCTIQVALTNTDPRLCDCNKIITVDAMPEIPQQPDKQKDITIKADWKYIGELSYHFSDMDLFNTKDHPAQPASMLREEFAGAVFHPPQA